MSSSKNQWETKYLREFPFMPYGSMMNAYSRINEGKGVSIEEFEKVSDKIFKMSIRYTEEAFDSVSEDTGIDIPIRKKKQE